MIFCDYINFNSNDNVVNIRYNKNVIRNSKYDKYIFIERKK